MKRKKVSYCAVHNILIFLEEYASKLLLKLDVGCFFRSNSTKYNIAVCHFLFWQNGLPIY